MSTRQPDARPARAVDDGACRPDADSAVEENVQAIKRWEHRILLARSRAEQVSNWIAYTAGSGPVLALHLVWFVLWVGLNAGDSDSVASIAGAILCARYPSSINKDWYGVVEAVNDHRLAGFVESLSALRA